MRHFFSKSKNVLTVSIALALLVVFGPRVYALVTMSSQVRVHLSSTLTNGLKLNNASSPIALDRLFTLTNGNGANQANLAFSDERTLAASATENLDLAGVLTDAFGNLLTFAKVRVILIYALPANTNNVLVGGAASNGFITPFNDATDIAVVKPGGMLLMIAPDTNGYAVTAATGDLLKITNSSSGTSITYDVIILGA